MPVRREAVRLEVEDHFTRDILKAAVAAQTLQRSLDGLSTSAVTSSKTVSRTERDVESLGSTSRKTGAEIDKLSGRMRILADVASIVGPALVPISAIAIPALTGLTAQVGFAVLGLGSLIVASQGVGDALKAVNEAALDPTTANLQKAQDAMDRLGPAAQAFVRRFQELRPTLTMIRDSAAAGWFPGLTEAMDSLDRVGPRVASIVEKIGETGGRLVADGADALAGPQMARFLSFVELNAPQALDELGRTIGNLTMGLANLWMAFDPVNDDFSAWLLKQSREFSKWSEELSRTQGFQEFVDYIETNGPRVAAALGAIGTAVVEIIEAVAPLGGPSLKIIELFGEAIAAIADSDIGTPLLAGVAALTLYTRGLQLAAALQTKLFGSTALKNTMATGGVFAPLTAGASGARSGIRGTVADLRAMRQEYGRVNAAQAVVLSGFSQTTGAAERTAGRMKTLAKTSAGVGALAIATTGVADGIGLTNTATLALAGSFAGPLGIAIGGAIGGIMDLDAATKGFSDTVADVEKNISDGKFGDAASELERLKDQAKDSNEITSFGDALSDIGKGLERVTTGDFGFLFGADEEKIRSLTRQLKGAKKAAEDQAAFDALAERYGTAGEKAETAARQTSRLKTAIASLNAIVNQQAAWDAYAASIDNVTGSVEENGRTLDSNTEAGRANRQAIRQLVISGQQYADTLSGLGRLRFMQGLLADFDAAVAKAGGATKATQNLRAELKGEIKALRIDVNTDSIKAAREKVNGFEDLMGNLDGVRATPKVDINKQPFDAKGTYVQNYLTMISGKTARPKVTLTGAESVEAILATLTRPRVVTIQGRYYGVNRGPTPVPAGANPAKQADGGTVRRADDGSTVPDDGAGYRDYLPYLLAPLEEVISNRRGQADMFRPELKDINAGLSRREVIERMLLRGLADGGTAAGLAGGGTPKGKKVAGVGALAFADLPEIKFATMNLKGLNRALRVSQKALEKETAQRQSVIDKMTELRSSVVDRTRSDLFGETDVWSAGGGIGDAVAMLNADSAKALRLKSEIAMFKSKGLDGAALDELLAKADDATVSTYARSSAAALRSFELAFERRAALMASVGSYASEAAYGAELRQQTREMKAVGIYVRRVEAAIKTESRTSRKAAKRGAGSGARSRKKS